MDNVSSAITNSEGFGLEYIHIIALRIEVRMIEVRWMVEKRETRAPFRDRESNDEEGGGQEMGGGE